MDRVIRHFSPPPACLVAFLWVASFVPLRAADPGTVRGITTSQAGSVLLPGVEVTAVDATGRPARTAVSDGKGRYEIAELPAGRYQVVGRLAGFTERVATAVEVRSGRDVTVNLDLALAPIAQDVKVVGEAGAAKAETAASKDTIGGRLIDVLPVAFDSYRALLPVLPGVVRQADGRISIKGARPTQGALKVGGGSGIDPSTGNFGIELPSDAVESVDVAPNPYAAEDGRFSSSLVQIETRAGTDQWRVVANSFIPLPCLTICDGHSVGMRNFGPRIWFGGPLVNDRVFIAQSLEYRMNYTRIPSLPDPVNLTKADSFDTFTRIDARLAPGHELQATLAFFPRQIRYANLNTFNPQEVTPDYRMIGYNAAVAETATLTPTTVLESFFSASSYHTTVDPRGDAGMEVTVNGNTGGYFNRQERRTHAYEWSETLTTMRRTGRGDHLLKAGIDILQASYTGTSESRPVTVRRADGTVSQQYTFDGSWSQVSAGTDVALFGFDRWRVNERLLLEPGVRVDRDGVLKRTSVSPRFGYVIGILPPDVGVLRGGVGVFYERTPLNVAAFESFEHATVTRFAADGRTPASSPMTFVPRAATLDTPRAFVWNVEYDHRLAPNVFLKLNHLRRYGSHEFVVNPVEAGAAAELRLASVGESRYRETEVTVRVGKSEERQVSASYVRSHSEGDLNAFDTYFGNYRQPIIRPNQYSLNPVDVPNRLMIKGVIPWRKKWTVSTLIELRNGFPYSVVNQDQEFVGVRNTGGRLPFFYTLDVGLIRSAKFLGRDVRLGVRGYHLLHTFAPRDIQANIDSGALGALYNGIARRFTLTMTLVPKF
jgi:hypothetical protein